MAKYTDKCPISYEAGEPISDPVADVHFTELRANAIVLELWATFGDQERYFCEEVEALIELIDATQKSSAGIYTVAKSLGYDLADPTELSICRAAELYFAAFTQ